MQSAGNVKVYNLSRFTFESLKGQDPGQLHQNLIDYITKFSPNVRDIFLDKFRFTDQLKRLKDDGILWNVFERFCEVDLHPETNLEYRDGLSLRGVDPSFFRKSQMRQRASTSRLVKSFA